MQTTKQPSHPALKWTRRVWLTDKVHAVPVLLPKKGGLELIGHDAESPYAIGLGADFHYQDDHAFNNNHANSSLLPGTPI